MNRKLLIVDVAALGFDLLQSAGQTEWEGLTFRPTQSVLPAVTCTVQASFRTALLPLGHGMVANGRYFPQLRKVMFWEQSAALVEGERIWARFRERGNTVGMMFWQQSMGEDVDLLLTPAPIHTHGGGMVMDCYGKPADLYEKLQAVAGGKFALHRYWGPLAHAKVGDWIARACGEVLTNPALAPDLLLTYLPSLDYDLQRHGPDHPKSAIALTRALQQLETLLTAARRGGYEVLIFGDYAIAPVATEACFPNRVLAEAGLLALRDVRGRLYPDFHRSRAFAVVDHEVAHVHVPDRRDVERVEAVLAEVPGVGDILGASGKSEHGLGHPNAGDLVLLADPGRWFAYPWWADRRRAPDYATHIDIHNKPGFDPCELLFGWPPISVSQDTSRIAGSHGHIHGGREVAWASTLPLSSPPENLIDLAQMVRHWLEN
ncbi:MAG: alkaline phosphatase family protein [Phycisphaerae bacterium]